ncbi:acetoacetate decarboxylase family protein [Desulforhopalus singaporensis]|uniref:Acetoacetate decarboxylase (ADC) n=1 Tax=Desulforhopalus singaporensis TaxID=91360 RepID=A0A1H0V8N4_9BACT|nr:acetoacetate decarboxylase family protein [Desulforhopalus singaporensis]SDP74800.1 Acetoacetate decarboxylase (ADC) [Desulforhopalus singaporensis]
MQKPHVVIHSNNMPIQAPICGEWLSEPYDAPDIKMLNVYARLDEEVVKNYLKPTPYEYHSNIGLFYFADYSQITSADAPFYDSALMVPVKYKDMTGGFYMFEFEDGPESTSSGREGWGHPKMMADRISMTESEGKAIGNVYLKGKMIYHVELDMNKKPSVSLPVIPLEPNLLHMKHPRPDGPGTYCEFTLVRYIEEDTTIKHQQDCEVVAFDIQGVGDRDPWHIFKPTRILGGEYIIADYTGSERTPPRILDRII